MKIRYEAPIAEKMEFDYTQVVVASFGGNHGDKGNGVSITDKGCDKIPGHNDPHTNGNSCNKEHGNGYGNEKTHGNGHC